MEISITVDFTQENRSDWKDYIPDRTKPFSPPHSIQKIVDGAVSDDVPSVLFAEAAINDPKSMRYAYYDGLLLQMSSTNVNDGDTATLGVFVELPKELTIDSIKVSVDYDWVGSPEVPDPDQPNYLGQVACAVTKSNLLELPERPFLVGTDTAAAGQQFALNILDWHDYRQFGTRLNSTLSTGYYDDQDNWTKSSYGWVGFDCATLGFDSIANFSPGFDPTEPPEAAPSNALGKFTLGFEMENSPSPTPHNKAPVGFYLWQFRPTPPENVWIRIWDARNFDPPERQYYSKFFENDVQDAQFAGAQIQTTTMNNDDGIHPWSNGPVGVRIKSITVNCSDKSSWQPYSIILKITLLLLGVLLLVLALQMWRSASYQRAAEVIGSH